MKHRLLRVRELLKRELSELIQKEFSFEGVLVTVNSVDVTPDLKQGHVYLGIIGDEKARHQVLRKLTESRGHLQKALSRRVILKFTPQLHFKIDDSVERGVNVLAIMENLPVAADSDDVCADTDPDPDPAAGDKTSARPVEGQR